MDDETSRERPRLECVGSFLAYAPEGQSHTIEIWTRFEAVHDRQRTRVHTGVIVLTTTDGRGVTRIAQGDYQLTDQPKVRLTSADPSDP